MRPPIAADDGAGVTGAATAQRVGSERSARPAVQIAGLRPDDSPALAPPPGNPRFPLMDACRGLAAIAIVLGHSYSGPILGHRRDFVDALGNAVQLFFALSGFLLFRPYLAALAGGRPRPRSRDFFQRRALRILPAYWFALTAMAVLLGSQFIPGAFSSRWWVFYGFGQVYLLHHSAWGIPLAWSLCVEVAFYLCLPLIAAAVERLSRWIGWRRAAISVLALLFVIGPVVRLLNTLPLDPGLTRFVERIVYALPGQTPFFVAGMVVALWSVRAEVEGSLPRLVRLLIRRPLLTWALAAGCFALVATVGGYQTPLGLPRLGVLDFRARFIGNQLVICLFVALVLLPAAFDSHHRRLPQRVLAWPPLAFAGLVSYGLYLWHAPLGTWLAVNTPLRDVYSWSSVPASLVSFAVILTAGLLAGTVSYYVVELPFLRLKRGWRGGGKSAPQSVAMLEPAGRAGPGAAP
jgi:peptidoglycan/LPS O-acetylase OafA/YrhL